MKRRQFLVAGTALSSAATTLTSHPLASAQTPEDRPGAIGTVQSGDRIRQSVMGWCFKPMDAITLAKHCRSLGMAAIEGVGDEHYKAIRQLGLQISLVGSHGFKNGPLDPDNHDEVEAKLRRGIDLAVQYGSPSVITFTGMSKSGVSDQAAQKNCLGGWKRVIGYAEEKGITLVLEHLNSVDDSHPMKGHPGYWGDDLHRCIDLVKAMDSPRFKLLFDIYHVQIMHGDLIRNIQQYAPWIGHYHTAGNPGRGELDDRQEINYPPIIRAIRQSGYDGYVAQEFIPTSDDPIASLREAVTLCDV